MVPERCRRGDAGRLDPGERAGTSAGQAPRPGRDTAPCAAPRPGGLVHLRLHPFRAAGRRPRSGADPGVPPVQSGVPAAARGGGGLGGDAGPAARPRRRGAAQHRHAPAGDPQGGGRPRRRPAAGGGMARVAVADQGRGRHHRRDRRRDPSRLRPALGADGAVRDVPDRRRRRWHESTSSRSSARRCSGTGHG